MDFGLSPESNLSLEIQPGLLGQILLYLAVVLVVVVLFFILLIIIRKLLHSPKFVSKAYRKRIFLLTVPQRELSEESHQKEIKEVLSGIDNFYANLGGLRAQRGLSAWLFGRQDTWSFEIVVGLDGLISFYAAIPNYLADYVSQQFLSQYPYLQIEEVEDYNIFEPVGVAFAGFLKIAQDKK